MDHVVTPSHQVANFAIDIIDNFFGFIGLPHDIDLEEFVYTIIVIALAAGLGWIVRIIVLFIIKKVPRFKNSDSVAALKAQNVFLSGSHIIPPIVFLTLIPFAFLDDAKVLGILLKISWIYLIYTFIVAINSILSFLWHRYDERDNVKNHPLKGLLQVSKGFVWLIALILVGSIILDKSPVALLTGLGAFAAILMLVFKDSILGMVSGVQLSQNDMLRVGDWIVVPGTPANGVVIDVSLTVVKVQNWDNTIAMLPPYTLVSTSFQNWRGMTDSGVRRIARSFLIDIDSVQQSTSAMLEDFKNIPFMNDYITLKMKQRDEGKVENTNNSAGLVNGTIDTNYGLFRAYMGMYLRNNKHISQSSMIMVNATEPTPNGMPLQLYCFTNTTDWSSYESIQSEIFEHFAAMLPRFGLYVFENPSGRDTVNQGFLEGGIKPNQVYGLPYQSIYNWTPGKNPYPNPDAYKYWDTPIPQNQSFDSAPQPDDSTSKSN